MIVAEVPAAVTTYVADLRALNLASRGANHLIRHGLSLSMMIVQVRLFPGHSGVFQFVKAGPSAGVAVSVTTVPPGYDSGGHCRAPRLDAVGALR
jgi:hypothetical protein